MRILILQDFLRNGGTERQTLLLAGDFANAGHTVSLLTFRPGGCLARSLPRRVHHHPLQPFDTGLDWLALGLRRALLRAAPAIVLCMGRMANCHGWRIQRWLPGTPVISTMRTGKSLPWLYRKTLRETRHTIANSHEAARTLKTQYGIPQGKISVIHNAVVFAPTSPHTPTNTPRPNGPAMLCTAMFRPEKNQRELIEIAAQLPRDKAWQLWLVGDGPARPACEHLARESGIAGRVVFLGFQEDPGAFYLAADLAVLASRYESLPNFLIEAHTHGLPSLAYAAGGVAECGGMVVPQGDQKAFRQLLERLLFDPAYRAECAASAKAGAQQFSRERQLEDYTRLFARLTGAQSPKPG
ncbi:MAG: glycosyltransferase [Puniceicoccales bacterium]|jgi:glycosyltransferase involved in cell wall biosynthesis|nr:glycosyltransferase [Puniceicoccales bacterium]